MSPRDRYVYYISHRESLVKAKQQLEQSLRFFEYEINSCDKELEQLANDYADDIQPVKVV